MFDHDPSYGEALVINAGALGLGGEMLDLLRKNKTRETAIAEEKPSIGIDQIRFIMVKAIVLRCSYGDEGISESQTGTGGDALALYNVSKFIGKTTSPELWDLIEQVEKDLEPIKKIDTEEYTKAIHLHIQRSIASDLSNIFGSKDTFGFVFSDVTKLQKNLPVVNLIEMGEMPPLPYDIDRYMGFGKVGSDSYFGPDQFLQPITLTTEELEAIWNSQKSKLSDVPLVDKTKEDRYWGQELLLKEIVEAYMSKVAKLLSEQEKKYQTKIS
jgi:hypothetical protein